MKGVNRVMEGEKGDNVSLRRLTVRLCKKIRHLSSVDELACDLDNRLSLPARYHMAEYWLGRGKARLERSSNQRMPRGRKTMESAGLHEDSSALLFVDRSRFSDGTPENDK